MPYALVLSLAVMSAQIAPLSLSVDTSDRPTIQLDHVDVRETKPYPSTAFDFPITRAVGIDLETMFNPPPMIFGGVAVVGHGLANVGVIG